MFSPEIFKSISQINNVIEGITTSDYSDTTNSVWGVVNKHGEYTKCPHTHCFAGSSRVGKGNKFFINRIQYNGALQTVELRKKHHKDLVKYYDMLFNDSVWADVFITKSGEEAVSTRFIVARTDVPSNMLIQAMQACRIPTEYHNTMWACNDLVDGGVNPKLAFVLGIMMRGGNFREGTVDFLDSGTNHTCMDPMYFNKKALKRMYDGNCQANQNYWNNPDYTSSFRIFETWGSQSDNELCNYIKENFRPKEILGIEKAKAECLNPFKRPERVVKPKHLWEYDLAIKAMIIFAKQIEEEFIYD